MADILKITTPLVEKMPVQTTRATTDPTVPFNLSDVSRVVQTNNASEMLQQNTGNIEQSDTPAILAELLKDPAVTVSLIRNIYLLEEVIGLVPANNITLTQEIEQLVAQMTLSPEEIVAELMSQEQNSTMFKGEVFDILRGLLAQNSAQPEVATSIGVLLKALNATVSQRDALDSVANNLTFLADSLATSPKLAEQLNRLIEAFRAPDAADNYTQLKQDTLAMLKGVENSLLFSPKMAKILPLIVYNLSRFNDNEDFLPDAVKLLLNVLPDTVDKPALVDKLQAFLDKFIQNGAAPARNDGTAGGLAQHAARIAQQDTKADSRVMDAISKLIGKSVESEDLTLLSGEKIDKIIHSLLSSPSNFTPLLHFVLPVEHQNIQAFAEIWIDPNAEEETGGKNTGGVADNIHMLMVFDVEDIGRFETELYVQGGRIAMNLMCPPAHVDDFLEIGPALRQAISAIGYRTEAINISRLERTHSLMDVFTDLPQKRTGIDVKV